MHPIRLRPRVVLLTALLALGLCPPGLAALDAGIAPPLAVDDAATVKTLTTIDIPVLDNDSDPDGDFLEITTPTEPTPTAHGSVLCGFDVCSYTSEADYTGPDGFDYTVSDGNGGTDVGHVAITVAANTEPVAVDDETDVRTGSTQTIFVLDNDFDADGDLIVVTTLAPSAAHGTVSCEDFGQCVYTSTPGYVGEDGFDYAISDGNGGTDTGHVSIQVFANTPPDALDDQAARSDSTVVDVLANDFDPDGDLLELVSVTQPAFGSATIDPDTSTIVYSQTSNLGASDSFTYTISDGSAQSTATVTLEPCPSLASALDAGGLVVGERWVMCSSPTANSAAGPTTTVLPPFNGTSALLTSGDVSEAPGPNDETGAGTSNGTQGRGAFDPSILRLDLNVPAGANCLSFDLAFQSEEFPEFVGSYNDGVLAELDASTWELDGNTINAPLNFAFDAGGGIVSVNSAFFSPDRVITDTGSQYDGSTPLLSVRTPITPGSHALYLSIFDAGDGILDSAAFIDRLAAGPAGPGGCAAGANEPPVAVDDEFEVVEDLEASLDVRANDSDPDGHEITITSSAPTAAHGTVSCSAFVCTYTPDADYFGPDSFTYSISDGHGGTDTATVSVTVTPVNDDPVATADVISTTEGSPGSANVLANDSDVDGDTVTILSFTQGLHGSVSCAGTDCTYTPNPGYSGPDSFTYTVSDGHGGTDVATVAVTVEPANEPPVADDETLTLAEDTSDSVDVLVGDTDPDGDSLTVTSAAPVALHGTVSCTGAGVCTYTPNPNYHGPDSFVYTVSDGNGGSDTGLVSVTVTPVNDDPVAVDDSATTDEDTATVVNVLANDADVDGDSLTVTTPSPTAAHGTVGCTAAGECTYTPNANYFGPDAFAYTISDGHGGTDTATVTINVTSVNDDPVATADVISTTEGSPGSANVLANDSDVDGDTVTILSFTQGLHGSVSCAGTDCTYTPNAGYSGSDSFTYTVSDGHGGTDVATVAVTVEPADNEPPVADDETMTTPEDVSDSVNVLIGDTDPDGDPLTVTSLAPTAEHGTVACGPGGTCQYTPAANYHGSDGFDYTVSDGHGGTDTGHVSITVTPVNDDPVAVDDELELAEDGSDTVNVLANDTDVDSDTLTVTTPSPTAAHGTVSCTAAGVCTYTPNANYNGLDSFTYTVSDGNDGSDSATVTITVTAVNDDPNAGDDSLSTGQDTAKDVNVLGNDTDVDGDSLTVTTLAPTATHGTVACTAAGVCTYTPEAGYTGSDSFDYGISDGHGGTDTATVSVMVTPNQDPSAVDDELTTAEDTAKGVDVLANDTDPEDDDLTVTSLAPSAAHGSVSCTGAGLCTYTPDANYHGSDGFDYAVSDGHGGTDTGHVSITVTPVNDDPVAVDDSATTGEDAAKVVSVLGNDSDVDGDSVTVTSASPTAAHGTVACTSGGECTYTPDANYNGPDSFVYTVSDGNGGSDTGHVAITVTPVNDDPNAGDDSLSTGQNTAKDVNVLGNDTDVDGDSLTVTTLAPAATHGTVACTAAGVCTYTPEAGYTGSDSFDYAISDGHGGTDTATVSVTVTPADTNTPPSCTNVKPSKTKLWPPRHKFKLIVLSGATDADGDPLTWTITKVTQDEKVKNAITKKDKGPDAKRVPGKPNQVELRAERIGDRNGRVYRIFFTVSDGNGGTCSGKVKVGVPKHKNGNAVDNVGKSYNSFG